MSHFNKKPIILILLALTSLASYAVFLYYTRSTTSVSLPMPSNSCSVIQNWKGLMPGLSTQQDVINTLGEPFDKGRIRFADRSVYYYAYKPREAKISNGVFDRIFFRSDGIIDWIEVIEADSGGDFATVFDVASRIGNELDIVYLNNNFDPSGNFMDILTGPDQIYVWSSCGLAIDAIPRTFSPALQVSKLNCTANSNTVLPEACELIPQYKSLSNIGGDLLPDADSVVLLKFYFQPTTYDAFGKYYKERIPFGIFDAYLLDISK